MSSPAFPIDVTGVGVFALSNAPSALLLARGSQALSQALGEVPVVQRCCVVGGPGRLAGDDATRVASFHSLVSEPSVNLLVAARGGFGVTRILQDLDFEALRRSEKALCGYSDVSALLLAAWTRGCRRLIHGPMVCSSWSRDPQEPSFQIERDSFLEVLQGRWHFDALDASPRVLKAGIAEGPVIPMNLTMLISLLGTPFQPDLTGTILVLEDVSEPAHAIQRMLVQLRSAGILKQLAGLVFADFSQGEDAEYLPGIFREAAEWTPGPVLAGYPLGHCHPSRACHFGGHATLSLRGK